MCLRRRCDSNISDAFIGSYDNYMDVEYPPILFGQDVLYEEPPFSYWPPPFTSGQNGANEIHHAILSLLQLLPVYEQEVADLSVAVTGSVNNGVADSGKNEEETQSCPPANEYEENNPEQYFLYIEDFLCDDDDDDVVEDEDEETETGIQGENLEKEVQEDEIDRKAKNALMEFVACVEKEIQEEAQLEEKKQNALMESVACAGEDSPVTYIESITTPTYSNATVAASASNSKKKYLSDGERIESESITASENVKVVEKGIKMGNVEDIKG